MLDMNLTDQVSSHEIAGLKNVGHEIDGHDIGGQDIMLFENNLYYNACLLYTSDAADE